ncbi:MAG: ABC transporter permease, partial [Thermoguttaceae bacterium]
MKPFSTIFWKEYRQQSAFFVALFAFVILLQFIAVSWAAFQPNEIYLALDPGKLISIALVISALYTTGSAAIIFCNEHEEKTFPFLRSLPISRLILFAGKLTWIIASSTAFLILTALESIPWMIAGTNFSVEWQNWQSPLEMIANALAIYALAVLFPMAWGLFWTTRLRSQMNALLFSLFSVSFSIWFAVIGARLGFNYQVSNNTELYFSFIISILLTTIAGVWGLISAYYWYDIWRVRFADKGMIEQVTKFSAQKSVKLRRPFSALFFQSIRQSLSLFWIATFSALCLAIVIASGFFLNISPNTDIGLFGSFLTFICGIVGFIFCASIFSSDHKPEGAFFAHHGISPRSFWWSRALSFGIAYFGLFLFLCCVFFVSTVIWELVYIPQIKWEKFVEN